MTTFDRMLEWSVDRHADRVAITSGDVSRTFREVDDRANALANALIELGVERGDRVGVLVGNQPEYPESEIAIVKAGGVRVPMLITSSTAEIERYIAFSDAEVVFVAEEALPVAREAQASLSGQGQRVQIIAIGEPVGDDLGYERLIEGASSTRPQLDLRDDDLYALRFTGGTSGLPKGILMDHRCFNHVVNNLLLAWPVGNDEVVCHFHPLSHAAGKIMYTWWMKGARQVILPAFDFRADVILETIERERVTAMFMVPTAINVLLDSGLLADYDTSSVRRIIYGGAPIPESRVREALKAFGPVLTQIYGCSEAPNALTYLLPEDHVFEGEPPDRLRSAGRAAYNVDLRIVDEHGADRPIGAVGEVISRGPHTMRGYWKDDALTAQRVKDGWVYTGDMGKWDADGYLYIVDRKDDVIITGGFNVWPAEVEEVLCSHPDVAEAAVFGAPDDKWGEAVTAIVVTKKSSTLTERDLEQHARSHLSKHKIPKRIVVREQPLPKSPVGKILRRQTRSEYVSDSA